MRVPHTVGAPSAEIPVRFPAVASLVVLCLLLPASRLHAAPGPEALYGHLSLGYGGWSQRDMNGYLGDIAASARESGAAHVDRTRFGGSPAFAGELGYRASEWVSFGFAGSFEAAKRGVTARGPTDFMGNPVYMTDASDWTLSLFEVTGNLTMWLPLGAEAPGAGLGRASLFLGANVGLCAGVADATERIDVSGYGASSYEGIWAGVGPAIGVFAGGQIDSPTGFLGFAKVGYHHRTMKHLKGDVTSDGSTLHDVRLDDLTERSTTLDFSGVYVLLGVGFTIHTGH